MKHLKRVFAMLIACVMMFTLLPGEQAQAVTMTPVQAHGQLRVNGTQIVDQKGNPF